MEIQGLGPVVRESEDDEFTYISEPIVVPVLENAALRFLVQGYGDDPAPEDFHAAIAAFLALDRRALTDAASAVFGYYREMAAHLGDVVADFPEITAPADVWDHVTFDGHEVSVERDDEGGPVYVSVEAECAWEVEHGLMLVFRDGRTVTKVGPYDGNVT